MKVGVDIVDWRYLRRFRFVRREQFVVMILTLGFTVFVDLVVAVAIGLIAAAMASARQFERLELDRVISVPLLDITFLGPPDDDEDFDPFSARVGMVALRGTFTAASAKRLITTLSLDIREHKVVILDFTDTVYMDESAALVVERMVDVAYEEGTECIVMGLTGVAANSLHALDVGFPRTASWRRETTPGRWRAGCCEQGDRPARWLEVRGSDQGARSPAGGSIRNQPSAWLTSGTSASTKGISIPEPPLRETSSLSWGPWMTCSTTPIGSGPSLTSKPTS